jgi:hypothetical protein
LEQKSNSQDVEWINRSWKKPSVTVGDNQCKAVMVTVD